jgi:hypothetical protein
MRAAIEHQAEAVVAEPMDPTGAPLEQSVPRKGKISAYT